ncbi:hypothetical protein MUP32_06505, partial [Candidatus Microgenomates bacterium]|nr:hypothetical protein [Candidatus Microgenomates bacterium]
NIQSGKFAANTKSESFFRKTVSGSYQADKKLASSETKYKSKTDAGVFMLNKPYETWSNNSDNTADTAKYKWQKIYYDGLSNGVLGTGKNLLTKTETCLYDNNVADKCKVAGKSEVVAYDAWGNVTQTRDGNGKALATVVFDNIFHALPVTSAVSSTDNSVPAQSTSTTYDYKLQVPLTVTDINGMVTKSEYDSLGRLIKVYKNAAK